MGPPSGRAKLKYDLMGCGWICLALVGFAWVSTDLAGFAGIVG